MISKKGSKLFETKNKVYLWIIAVLDFIILLFQPIIGILGFLLLGYLLYYNWRSNKKRNKRWQNYIENLSGEIDSAARYAILNLPFPLTLIDFDGKIKWYNSKFTNMIEQKELIGQKINELFNDIEVENLIKGQEIKDIKVKGKIYDVFYNIVQIGSEVDSKESNFIMMLYWIDMTEFKELEVLFKDSKPVVALIEMDNIDEVLKETPENQRPIVSSKIEKEINLWASRINGLVKKYQNDRYIVIFEKKFLKNLEAKRFAILDKIREIDEGNRIPPTISVGIGLEGKGFDGLEKSALSGLELALARGGDQAVVYKNDDYKFYGGKSKAVEKRNRVKARIIAHALIPIIEESSNVIIMGHRHPDMDSYGAAIGIYTGVVSKGKDAYILLNEESDGIKNVHQLFKGKDTINFVKNDQLEELIDDSSLLIVVDTHRPSFTENPQLVQRMNRIVMIDHHRRGKEFIEDTLLSYQETYASSTSELVTELLQYLDKDIDISKDVAEALLAGIFVDTKSFTFQTGVRTFEAASYLRRYGADTVEVKQLFQDDLQTYVNKSSIVSNANIYFDDIAISTFDKVVDNIQVIGAQAADQLLNIKGIKASFVIAREDENNVFISGRSLGKISVQIILERLGGGGHINVAGAQFKDLSIDEVKDKLIKTIEDYKNEEEEK